MAFKVEILPHVQTRIDACRQAYAEAIPYRYKAHSVYVEILNKFYGEEIIRRMELVEKIGKDPDKVKTVLKFMGRRENIVNTMVDWGWTYDPRLSAEELPTTLPWIPWQEQINFIEWTYNLYLEQRGGVVVKSRDCGATWLMCNIMLQEWRWVRGFAGGIGSNKLDNVDKRDDPDCIFEKLRSVLKTYPSWWMPRGWNDKKHNKMANLINVEMGSNISGQGGKEIGRGGRRSIYLNDEKASFDWPEAADAALSAVTNCQIDLSTPKGMNSFGQKACGGQLPRFDFKWEEDMRKNAEWRERWSKGKTKATIAQELDRDFLASVPGIMIKPEWVKAAVGLQLAPKGHCSAGLDVAAGGENKSALALRRGPYVIVKAWDFNNAIDLVHMVIDICNEAKVEVLHYDAPSVGFAVTSSINRTEKEINFAYFGWEPAGPKSDTFYLELNKKAEDAFLNARSEAYYNLARRFEKTWEYTTGIRSYDHEELISIEDDPELRTQLSSFKKEFTESGKIRVESKDRMIARGIPSPDKSDAVNMAFLAPDGGYKHVVEGYLTMGTTHGNFSVDWRYSGIRPHKHYGAVVLGDDMMLDILCAAWDDHKGHLYIYDELSVERPNPFQVVPTLVEMMRLKYFQLDRLIGNSNMFNEGTRDFAKQFNKELYEACGQFQHVKVKPARKYDAYGAATILNDLVLRKRITIHTKCRETCRQISTWRLDQGKIKEDRMREGVLLIVSELNKSVYLREILKVGTYYKTGEKPVISREFIKEEE